MIYIHQYCALKYFPLPCAPYVTMDFTNIPGSSPKTFKYELKASILIYVEVFCSLKYSILWTSTLEKQFTEPHVMGSSQLAFLGFCCIYKFHVSIHEMLNLWAILLIPSNTSQFMFLDTQKWITGGIYLISIEFFTMISSNIFSLSVIKVSRKWFELGK